MDATGSKNLKETEISKVLSETQLLMLLASPWDLVSKYITYFFLLSLKLISSSLMHRYKHGFKGRSSDDFSYALKFESIPVFFSIFDLFFTIKNIESYLVLHNQRLNFPFGLNKCKKNQQRMFLEK